MTKIVVLSDSHGYWKLVEKISPLFAENDFVIHLGDGSRDMRPYSAEDPDKFILLQGNCDALSGLRDYVLEAEGKRIFCCHGHRYGVKRGLEDLAQAAKERDCDIALYGHTHSADICEVNGVLCINPGAMSGYMGVSYCYLVLHGDKVVPTIVEVTP